LRPVLPQPAPAIDLLKGPPPREAAPPRPAVIPAREPVRPASEPRAAAPAPAPEPPREPDPYVKQVVDPQHTFEVARGHTRLLVLKEPATRFRVGDDKVAACEIASPTELALGGREVGSTVLSLWFADSLDPSRQKFRSYLVRVVPAPDVKARLESACKALADDINRAFPDSQVNLAPVGDKVAVSGQCKDANEAAQILGVVRTNHPGQAASSPGET